MFFTAAEKFGEKIRKERTIIEMVVAAQDFDGPFAGIIESFQDTITKSNLDGLLFHKFSYSYYESHPFMQALKIYIEKAKFSFEVLKGEDLAQALKDREEYNNEDKFFIIVRWG